MMLHLANRSKYEHLHLSTALEDWDMMEELNQCVTIDQYFAGAEEKVEHCSVNSQQSLSKEPTPQELSFKPTLWLVVDPNLVIPCPDLSTLTSESCVSNSYKHPTSENTPKSAAGCLTTEDSEEEPVTSVSKLYVEDDPPYTPISSTLHVQRCHGRKVRVRRSLSPYEKWPRPPINYCNLISLALRNSEDGSLNVQQIYSFVREHFPFFHAAPDGWKNTVRHNLCFSSSFEKIAGWVCADGHRRSCLWKLTSQGRKKFRTEVHGLSDELLRILRRSMTKPALMELMFGM
ncbi:forkhead box protein R1 [Rana temporaria]|uniref:forkhead box protein R1 n=1 Tax=Rana temporaria TaxID=8407 RepID=UPI001AADCAB5|nr:forkhead box protein R1 [Rana temporaria]